MKTRDDHWKDLVAELLNDLEATGAGQAHYMAKGKDENGKATRGLVVVCVSEAAVDNMLAILDEQFKAGICEIIGSA